MLETFNHLSEDECEDKCLNHRLCKSINTKSSNGINCELNSKSTEDPFDDAIATESTGWTYRTTDYKARNVSEVTCSIVENLSSCRKYNLSYAIYA